MRIAIDARMMGAERSRGIGRYTQELVGELLRLAPEEEWILVTPAPRHLFANHPSVQTVVADIPWYGFEEQWKMPRIIRRLNADVVHVPHWNVPLAYRGSLVITIHDLLLRRMPTSAKASSRGPLVRVLKRVGYRLTVDHAVRRAQRILVPTHAVQEEVAFFYPEAVSRVVVTGEGMPRYRDPAEIPRPPTLHGSYLLYVGSAYPHKGLEDLFDAWKRAACAYPNLSLVIAGERDFFLRRYETLVSSQGIPRVRFLGRVSDAELRSLYAHATAFVFPSHLEGFGLPPLEALAEGCPVICSDIPALREVLGLESAVFFRPKDPDGILKAIQEVVASTKTWKDRVPVIAHQLEQRHAWTDAARRTLEVYRSIVSTG